MVPHDMVLVGDHHPAIPLYLMDLAVQNRQATLTAITGSLVAALAHKATDTTLTRLVNHHHPVEVVLTFLANHLHPVEVVHMLPANYLPPVEVVLANQTVANIQEAIA